MALPAICLHVPVAKTTSVKIDHPTPNFKIEPRNIMGFGLFFISKKPEKVVLPNCELISKPF